MHGTELWFNSTSNQSLSNRTVDFRSVNLLIQYKHKLLELHVIVQLHGIHNT